MINTHRVLSALLLAVGSASAMKYFRVEITIKDPSQTVSPEEFAQALGAYEEKLRTEAAALQKEWTESPTPSSSSGRFQTRDDVHL